VLAVMACSRREPITSCDDDLRGVYAAGDERWMLLDRGDVLEAYPLFPDGMPVDPASAPRGGRGAGTGSSAEAPGGGPAEVIVAPRVIEFRSSPAGSGPGSGASGLPARKAPLEGTLRRRYMRGAERCDAHVPVHITRCAGDLLELVLSDPAPPLAYAPCTWSRLGPSRLVRWRRE